MIIGISGVARAGKDTFGGILKEVLGGNYITIAFADELKMKCMDDFNLSYDQVYGHLKEVEDNRYPKKSGGYWTPREILQFIGTDTYRVINDDFWIEQLFKNIGDSNNVIITDCRFPVEIHAVKKRFGKHIRVTRNNRDFVADTKHSSETSLDNFNDIDYVVDNNGTIEDLYKIALTIKGDIENGR